MESDFRRSSVNEGSDSQNADQLSRSVMSPEEAAQAQKPYRYGMILLCFGALINWVGLAENYTEPIRYAGVACIVGGALLICTAMCCWLQTSNRIASGNVDNDDPIHIISSSDMTRIEKPPEYETVAVAPPNYDDAIKLDPIILMHTSQSIDTVPSYEYAMSSSPSSSLASISSVAMISSGQQQCSESSGISAPTMIIIHDETQTNCSLNKLR